MAIWPDAILRSCCTCCIFVESWPLTRVRLYIQSDRRLVEAGRVCLINYGPLCGKLCVIINVVDSKIVLIDGPSTVNGVKRHLFPLKRLSITNLKCDILPGARLTNVVKAFEAADVSGKWAASSWAKGMAKKVAKSGMGDFDRFTMMVARKTRARAVNKAMKSMKKK